MERNSIKLERDASCSLWVWDRKSVFLSGCNTSVPHHFEPFRGKDCRRKMAQHLFLFLFAHYWPGNYLTNMILCTPATRVSFNMLIASSLLNAYVAAWVKLVELKVMWHIRPGLKAKQSHKKASLCTTFSAQSPPLRKNKQNQSFHLSTSAGEAYYYVHLLNIWQVEVELWGLCFNYKEFQMWRGAHKLEAELLKCLFSKGPRGSASASHCSQCY